MNRFKLIAIIVGITLIGVIAIGCIDEPTPAQPKSNSGVKKTSAEVKTGADGLTVEQRNVKRRLEKDNQPGSIKHLYIISAYSGQVIMYSTVDGKVTSSGKRLTPNTVAAIDGEFVGGEHMGFNVDFGGTYKRTGEVLQDDGTYGSSAEYIYWFDSKGNYQQHYISGGQIVHISDQPIVVKGVIMNLEVIETK